MSAGNTLLGLPADGHLRLAEAAQARKATGAFRWRAIEARPAGRPGPGSARASRLPGGAGRPGRRGCAGQPAAGVAGRPGPGGAGRPGRRGRGPAGRRGCAGQPAAGGARAVRAPGGRGL